MEGPTLKNRLEVGEKIFYFDGQTQWDIETVESVNKAEKSAVLSNNAHISRYPNPDGTFEKLNPTKSYFPNRPGLVIRRATDDIIKLRTAIMSYKKIKGFIFNIEQGLMKTTNLTEWQKWSEHKQDQLISLAGHLAKGMEEAELTEEDWEALSKYMEEPIENINPIVEKKRKNKSKK